ncbi:MAG: hypothetical protein IK144_07060 [Bacteroidaceae bacterium]|nr:hypothetical protein [Bacteroidaceae bacterium]
MKQKLILMFALLCVVAQGAWAQIPDPTVYDDVWDGHSTSRPEYYSGWQENPAYKGYSDVVIIKKASELAYVRDNFKSYEKKDILLMANLDMGAVSWIPMGNNNGSITSYWGTFYGNGHTIRIVIKDATANYQGLFAEIGVKGKVRDLHVTGKIACKASRMVGGIAGESWSDEIRNCWVSADVSSDWKESASSYTAKVGGIVGANESSFSPSYIKYCIMTGNVKNNDADVGGIAGFNAGRLEKAKCVIDHVTFYGSVSSTHKQDNKYVGDQDGKLNDEHDSFTESELAEHLNSFTGNDLYRYAVKYPYAVTVKIVGPGTIRTQSGDGYDVRGTRSGNIFLLNVTSGTATGVTIKDADGKDISWQGQSNDTHAFYQFVMPKKNVTATVTFSTPDWLKHAGTENDPYIITSTAEWNEFANFVNNGINFNEKYIKLDADISVSTMAGTSHDKSFQGTFDGSDHTLTFTKGTASAPFAEDYCAPFRHVKNAYIMRLKVAGEIYTSAMKAAGLVGESHGALYIQSCRSSLAINSSKKGDGTHGGFVATLSGKDNPILIEDCTFDGSFATTNGTVGCGGFIGWPVYNKPIIKYSFMIPTSVAPGMLNNTFARWHSTYEPSIKESYFIAVDNLPGNQGAELLSTAPNPESEIYAKMGQYYVRCTVSGVENYYQLLNDTSLTLAPVVTAADGTVLKRGVNYTYTPSTITKPGEYTMTVTASRRCVGKVTLPTIYVADAAPVASDMKDMKKGKYCVYKDVTIEDRITISGDVVLYLGAGTLTAKKGIELSEGNSLTIEGPGTLVIDGCDYGKSGIGAYRVGTLTINEGNINVTGGGNAAAIGGDLNNETGGSITINGGVIKATGGNLAAGIGGGADVMVGHYGVCGDITINSGQVTARGGYTLADGWPEGNMAGIGPGAELQSSDDTFYHSGTLKLGWTIADDFVYSSGYANPDGSTLRSITFTKPFLLDGTQTVATDRNIRGRKIVPQK